MGLLISLQIISKKWIGTANNNLLVKIKTASVAVFIRKAYAVFLSALVAFLILAGLLLPKLPIEIFPRLVRLSPLPMIL